MLATWQTYKNKSKSNFDGAALAVVDVVVVALNRNRGQARIDEIQI